MTVEHAAALLAEAEAELSAVMAQHSTASDKAARIRARLAEVNARKTELHAARINGSANASSEAQIMLLTGDADALTAVLAEAQKAIPDVSREQAVVNQRRHDFEAATRAARLEILKARASECDTLLCRLMSEIAEHGPNLCQLWMPSHTLQRTITREFPALFG